MAFGAPCCGLQAAIVRQTPADAPLLRQRPQPARPEFPVHSISGGACSSTASAASSKLQSLGALQDRVSLHCASHLGSGSLGVVLLAEGLRNGQKLAVKAISLKAAKEAGFDECQLWREAQILKEVQHPNVVRLLDVLACWDHLPHVNSEPPYLCIVMEYIAESEPLSNVMRRNGASPYLAEKVLPQLARALSRMHQLGVVHRDVWSENVLLDDSGRAVLVDLGSAEYIGGKPAVNSKLNIPYMSPEAAQGLRQSPGDDSWALGLLMTEMVTGVFIADRLGRSDLPMHYNHTQLAASLSETFAAAPGLGAITRQLLELNTSRRLDMAHVLEHLRLAGSSAGDCFPEAAGQGSAPAVHGNSTVLQFSAPQRIQRAVSPMPTRHPSPAPPGPGNGMVEPRGIREVSVGVSPLRQRGFTTSCSSQAAAATTPCGAAPGRSPPPGSTAGAPRYLPGQAVLYCPRCLATGVHRAKVLGRTADDTGWQIQFDSGPLQDIGDSEEWRLCPLPSGTRPPHSSALPLVKPVASNNPLSFVPVPTSTPTTTAASSATASTASATSATAVTSTSSASAAPWPLAMGAPTVVAAAASASMPARSAGATLVASAQVAQYVVPSSNSLSAIDSGRQIQARTVSPMPASVVRASAPAAKGASLCSQSPIGRPPASALPAGRRVVYTARSNGQPYPGTVVGTLLGRPGLRLHLDCGEQKDVEEAEVWRVVPAPVSGG